MRPHEDEVELLYEIMTVTGEAAVMIMIMLNYLKSVELIQMEPIPPIAIAACSVLVVGGNLGAQVCLADARPQNMSAHCGLKGARDGDGENSCHCTPHAR